MNESEPDRVVRCSPSRVRVPARIPRASGRHGITPTPWSMHCGIISSNRTSEGCRPGFPSRRETDVTAASGVGSSCSATEDTSRPRAAATRPHLARSGRHAPTTARTKPANPRPARFRRTQHDHDQGVALRGKWSGARGTLLGRTRAQEHRHGPAHRTEAGGLGSAPWLVIVNSESCTSSSAPLLLRPTLRLSSGWSRARVGGHV